MRLFYQILSVIIVIGIIVVSYWFYNKVPTSKINPDKIVQSYRVKSFSGVVKDKYIDQNEHNWKKVIIVQKSSQETILFNWETGGVFDFIAISDTIMKKEGSLEVRLKNKEKDTIMEMQFYSLN